MNTQETKVTDYAASHGQPVIRMAIFQVMGRSIEDVKLMGLLPGSFYANGDDFNLYVRWDVSYGAVYVTRSDTDEVLITVGLARKGKIAAFGELMQALADRYGVPVYVELDYGISGAQASKLVGRWAPQVANISIPQPAQVYTCSVAGCTSGQAPVMLLKIATGPSAKYTNDTYFCGVCWPWYEHSTELGNVLESISLAQADDMAIPTNAPAIDGYEWKRHTNPGEAVWAGSTYQLIVAGSNCQVAATVTHRGHGLWAAAPSYWGMPGLTRDFWVGESLADAFAQVVAFMEFLARAQATGMPALEIARLDWRTWVAPEDAPLEVPTDAEADALIAEHDAGMDAWVAPLLPALPIRTPGATWDLVEADIWAGTDLVEPMRRTRLSRRGKRALEKAFQQDCCGRADHERWCRTWRPITKRHARLMGIDRKDAVLLRPKFADLLAARVGK